MKERFQNKIFWKQFLVLPGYDVVASIPVTSISEMKRFSKRNLPKDKQMFLMDGFEIICSSIQSHRVRTHNFYLFSLLNFSLFFYGHDSRNKEYLSCNSLTTGPFVNGMIWTMSILAKGNQRFGKEQQMQRDNWVNFFKFKLSERLSC